MHCIRTDTVHVQAIRQKEKKSSTPASEKRKRDSSKTPATTKKQRVRTPRHKLDVQSA